MTERNLVSPSPIMFLRLIASLCCHMLSHIVVDLSIILFPMTTFLGDFGSAKHIEMVQTKLSKTFSPQS